MESALFVLALLVGFIVWVVVKYRGQHASNRSEGVLAEFRDLRLTATELIEGYGRSPRRYPLVGMHAEVEDSNHLSVYLTVHSSAGVVLREVSLKERSDAGLAARAFAAQINLRAGRPTGA